MAPTPIGSSESRLREQMVTLGRSLFDRGLSPGSSGNISVRLDDGWLLTPTNACMGFLDPARISKLDWQGKLINGDPPSKEAFLHRAMYETRAAAGAIVHLHATHSAAVSCTDGLDSSTCIPPMEPPMTANSLSMPKWSMSRAWARTMSAMVMTGKSRP